MNTSTNAIEYEVHMRDARQQRAEEIASIFKSVVAFFRSRKQSTVEKEFRPVAIDKHGHSMWPAV